MNIKSLQNEANVLFEAFREGDRESFNSFFIKFYPIFCSYANHFLEYDESEEVVQNAMVWIWENKEIISVDSSILAYCFKIVKNSCLKQKSRNELRVRIFSFLYKDDETMFEDPNFYIREELYLKIKNAIESLPENYRKVFEMNRFKGMTYKEIASELNVSPKTVDYRIQCALKQLRIDLKDYMPLLMDLLF